MLGFSNKKRELFKAINNEDKKKFKELLKSKIIIFHSVDINTKDEKGRTPLLYATDLYKSSFIQFMFVHFFPNSSLT